ncbi:MAG: response regulator transcription factor [Rudaea sp.]|nr:response regulator transcription factor [Rudaea sp.]
MQASTTLRSVLVIDDDLVFARVLARALDARGFITCVAHGAAAAVAACQRTQPSYAVLDLRLGADNGLKLIPELREIAPHMRILLLTGYASIATAVEAIKRGADDYLAKPVDADAVVAALLNSPDADAQSPGSPPEKAPSLKRLEWEQIQRVLNSCGGNVSLAAQKLGLHRRTLQRKLAKRPVRESP